MPGFRVAYGAMSPNHGAPGDRRRFAGFARRNGIELVREFGTDQPADITVLTLGADLSRWEDIRRRHGIVIIDIVDSYLAESRFSPRRLLRGTYKKLNGEMEIFHLSFAGLLKKALSQADAVVCASEEQRRQLLMFNDNIHVIVDCFDEFLSVPIKRPDPNGERVLVWEGFPENLKHMRMITRGAGGGGLPFPLVVVSKPVFSSRARPGTTIQTSRYLDRLGFPHTLVPWSVQNLLDTAARNPIAIIPIDEGDPMAWNKSENKLLGFWSLGLMALVSPTPSYRRVIERFGFDQCLVLDHQWKDRVRNAFKDRDRLTNIGTELRSIADTTSSGRAVDERWYNVFRSVGVQARPR